MNAYRTIYAATVCACGQYFEARGEEPCREFNASFQAHAKTCATHKAFDTLPKMQIGETIRRPMPGQR